VLAAWFLFWVVGTVALFFVVLLVLRLLAARLLIRWIPACAGMTGFRVGGFHIVSFVRLSYWGLLHVLSGSVFVALFFVV